MTRSLSVSASILLLMMSQPAFAQAWYEGGTLQKANVSQWQAGSSENQLATAADFIASLSGITDLSAVKDPTTAGELKHRAVDLQECVNQSIQPGTSPEQPVAELIIRCTVLKPR